MKSEILDLSREIQGDFDKRQLLAYKADKSFIVLSSGEHRDNAFNGTIVQSDDEARIGEFSVGWAKSSFILFTGELKLSN